MHTVLETQAFARSAKAANMDEDEKQDIMLFLSKNPTAGDLIKGTGGARKVRFRAPGRGKSGGYRVVTYYAAEDVPLFLLDVFSKSEKINLSKEERNEFKAYLVGVAEDYRASVKEKVMILKERAS